MHYFNFSFNYFTLTFALAADETTTRLELEEEDRSTADGKSTTLQEIAFKCIRCSCDYDTHVGLYDHNKRRDIVTKRTQTIYTYICGLSRHSHI